MRLVCKHTLITPDKHTMLTQDDSRKKDVKIQTLSTKYFNFTIPDDVNELHPIRNWNHTIYGTHLTNINMTHDNTRIVIPESGRYYVYSQVSFLIHYDIDRNNAQEVTQLLYQSVIRYNAMYPLDGNKEMLRGVTTQCWEKQKKYGKYTTYAGASVMLNKGDQIYVKSSTVNHVFNHDSMTYFGLFKIG